MTDGTILLRPFRIEDAEAHLAGEDAEQVRWLSGGRSTLAGVRSWIERNQAYWAAGGPVFLFAITEARTAVVVGMVEASMDRERISDLREGDANISYGLYPAARGRGYATRAVGLVLKFLAARNTRRGLIRVDPRNEPSARVAKRAGFERESADAGGHDVYVRTLAMDNEA